MTEEKKPSTRVLLPEGWRRFKIVDCKETTSKKGNLMFVITARDHETGYDDTWFAVAEPKKRWFLKAILSAIGLDAGQDGNYEWEISDVLEQDVMGLVVHEDNNWINREGESVTTKQHKVTDVIEAEALVEEPKKVEEVKGWDS